MKTMNVKWLELNIQVDTVCDACGAEGKVELTVKKEDPAVVVQETEADLKVDELTNRIAEILHASAGGCPWKTTRSDLRELIGQDGPASEDLLQDRHQLCQEVLVHADLLRVHKLPVARVPHQLRSGSPHRQKAGKG